MNKHYIFLIDSSYSMAEYIYFIINGLNKFIYKLKMTEPQNYITIAHFNSELYYINKCIRLTNVSPLSDTFFKQFGGTALYDSLYDIITNFNYDDIDLYHNLYIITDDDDNMSLKYNKIRSQELCNAAKKTGKWNIIHFHTKEVVDLLNNITNIEYNKEDLSNLFSNLQI